MRWLNKSIGLKKNLAHRNVKKKDFGFQKK